jgi:hypothetical protein
LGKKTLVDKKDDGDVNSKTIVPNITRKGSGALFNFYDRLIPAFLPPIKFCACIYVLYNISIKHIPCIFRAAN